MALAIILVALVVGSIIFHLVSPWWLTPLASNWGRIDDALVITLWICAVAFVALNLFIAYTLVRYRHRPGSRAAYEPENNRLERRLTLWTAIGIVGMLAPGLLAWNEFVTVPNNAAVVEAVGQQWQWSYRFPGKDGVLGTASAQHVTPENPLGLNPKDPHGHDDRLVEAGDLHLPVDRPVKLLLRSKDVLHDFYVPQFRAKMDLVPGVVTYVWLTPTRKGSFEVLCAELCGIGHHLMRSNVVVSDDRTFQAWLSEQPTFAELMVAPPMAANGIAPAVTLVASPNVNLLRNGTIGRR